MFLTQRRDLVLLTFVRQIKRVVGLLLEPDGQPGSVVVSSRREFLPFFQKTPSKRENVQFLEVSKGSTSVSSGTPYFGERPFLRRTSHPSDSHFSMSTRRCPSRIYLQKYFTLFCSTGRRSLVDTVGRTSFRPFGSVSLVVGDWQQRPVDPRTEDWVVYSRGEDGLCSGSGSRFQMQSRRRSVRDLVVVRGVTRDPSLVPKIYTRTEGQNSPQCEVQGEVYIIQMRPIQLGEENEETYRYRRRF